MIFQDGKRNNHFILLCSLLAQIGKNQPAMQETQVQSLHREDPLEKEMATHTIILAWRIPWTVQFGGLQSMRSQRLGHDWSNLAQNNCAKQLLQKRYHHFHLTNRETSEKRLCDLVQMTQLLSLGFAHRLIWHQVNALFTDLESFTELAIAWKRVTFHPITACCKNDSSSFPS